MSCEKFCTLKFFGDGHHATKYIDDGIPFGMDAGFFLRRQLIGGENQKCAKDINDPFELMNERGTERDECPTQYQCAEDTEKENAMLIFSGNLKIGKDDDKNKNVINGKGFFNQIAGEKFETFFETAFINDKSVKGKRDADPEQARPQRFFGLDFV